MTRLIPDAFIDDLLARTDIIDIVSARITVKKSGKNYSACCPFHQEKTPSFTVSPQKQFFYCFGCGASGDAIAFIRDFDRIDFVEAIEHLAKQAGVEIPNEQKTPQRSPIEQASLTLLAQACDFYQQQLQLSPLLAQKYLTDRGLSEAICARFSLGFAPTGWQSLYDALNHSKTDHDALLTAGLIIENDNQKPPYDRFRERIMFPIRDRRGRVIAFGGRILNDGKPKYLNSPETPFFHKSRTLYGLYEAIQANRQLEHLMVVEGYMDVIGLADHEITNAVATLGTACTEEHITQIFKQVKTVIFCFDGDTAGEKAAWRALQATLPHMEGGYSASFVFLPEGEDPDSLIRKEGTQHFQQRMQHTAIDLADWLFQQLQKDLDTSTLSGCNRLIDQARPYLQQTETGLYRSLLTNRLAQITGTTPEELKHTLLLRSEPPTPAPEQKVTHDNKPKHPLPVPSAAQPPPDLSGRIIQFILQDTKLAQDIAPILLPLQISLSDDFTLLQQLLETLSKQPHLTPCHLLGQWHGTEQGRRLFFLAERMLKVSDVRQDALDSAHRLSIQIASVYRAQTIDTLRNSNESYKHATIKDTINQLKHQFHSDASSHNTD